MFLGSKNSLLIFLQSYHVWVTSRHVTSCHVIHVSRFMLRHVTSCHVISRHVISCHVMSRNVTSRHVTSCHVMSRHVTSWHVMSRRKSRDGHTTNASLSTDFFHTPLIRVEYDRVRWFSRRLPIPYRISGIWSSYYFVFKYVKNTCVQNFKNSQVPIGHYAGLHVSDEAKKPRRPSVKIEIWFFFLNFRWFQYSSW